MTQQPSDYPVADPGDEPDRVEVFVADEELGSDREADTADALDQHLPRPGDDEEDEAIETRSDREAKEDGDRLA